MVCDHLCHSKCTRINYDNPLLIREIKRFAAENSTGNLDMIPTKLNGLKAAIIGAGPSGLTCAYFLALEGFEVNLYESKSFAGGMTSDAIPHFRLTDEGIRNDIEIINSLGVNFIFDYEVNLENLNEIQENNDFVYLGVGAQRGKKLNIPGEESDGVLDQLEFLSAIRQGKEIILGNKVCIIGGGNSAVDAARTSNKIVGNDGEVTVIYRRTKNEMPADKEEIDALIEEGVNLIELTSPKMFNVNDRRVDSVICLKMKLGKKDKSGRPSPVIIQDSEFEIQADNVITAIGQEVSNNFISGKTIKVNSNTNETEYKNVFAGGDAVRGADSLINAMGDGKHVAENIIRSVVEQSLIKEKTSNQKLDLVEFQKKLSHREFGPAIPSLEVEDRIGFNLVHSTLEEEQAVQEANRCLYCNDICNICVTVCPNLSNLAFTVEPTELPVHQIIRNENDFKSEIISTLKIDQQNQILNIADFCNECGNCTTFCPTSGEPYKTKPRFYNKSVGKYNFKQAAEMYFLLMSLMDFHVFIK
jgi:putative selenate reductase